MILITHRTQRNDNHEYHFLGYPDSAFLPKLSRLMNQG
jgi:hypothetical protein